ncbi:MAG: helix-turn-helix domain-containing protein [Oscillospiraceae bacterium]|jgi:transcriptional regulator with XRE-family HTH domain
MSGLGNKRIMADNIQYYLDRAEKTRADLCRDLGFKYSTVSEWLMARRYPRIDKIEMMADYFGITKSDLVEERREKPQPGERRALSDPLDMRLMELLRRASPEQKKAWISLLESLAPSE